MQFNFSKKALMFCGGILALYSSYQLKANAVPSSYYNYKSNFISLDQEQNQVTSVSQLRDIAPSDWAYEALKGLVERYGCIVGYPDRTFRGDRALSRWEFAAGLNACLNSMERIVQQGYATKADVETLKKLAQDFQIELNVLGRRIEKLDNKVAFLENHQFSTTTKLNGEAVFSLAGATTNSNQTVLQNRVRLEFDTSFTGDDVLVTRFASGNFIPFNSGPVLGGVSPTTTLVNSIGAITNNSLGIDVLAYYGFYQLGNFEISTYIAPWGANYNDYVPLLDPYFTNHGDGGRGALTPMGQNAPIVLIGGGTGAGVNMKLGYSTLTMGYMSGNNGAGNPQPSSGLFNGGTTVLAQYTQKFSESFTMAFTYVNAYDDAGVPIFNEGVSGLIGGALIGTQLANGFSGADTSNPDGEPNLDSQKVSNSYGVEMSWKISKNIVFNGFGSYTNVDFLGTGDTGLGGTQSGKGEVWSFGGRLGFLDVGKQGALLGFVAGVQPYYGNISVAGINGNYSTSMPVQLELFYKYPVNNNVLLTPGIIWLSHPTQAIGDGSQLIGVLRATYSF
jgi:hypothetical protein